jgi:H+/gluconate symporter-like permease
MVVVNGLQGCECVSGRRKWHCALLYAGHVVGYPVEFAVGAELLYGVAPCVGVLSNLSLLNQARPLPQAIELRKNCFIPLPTSALNFTGS